MRTLPRQTSKPGGIALSPGVLLLADRLFVGAALWQAMAATGAELVWRARCGRTAPKLPVEQVLADGSWLSHLRAAHGQRVRVRVVEYALADPGRRTTADRYRLVTTVLGPTQAPAAELAALYTERWEVETALAELKTTQRGPGRCLRSKTPDGVAQEVWAHLLVHYALRAVVHQAALDEDLDPDRLSFVRTLRVVKRKMSNYQLKRAQHRTWPQPTKPPAAAVSVLPPALPGHNTWHKLPKPLTGWHCA